MISTALDLPEFSTIIDPNIESISNDLFNPVFAAFFLKFFAGDRCLNHGYVDMPLQEIYLWDVVKFSTNTHVKHISTPIKRFKKTSKILSLSTKTTTKHLIKLNTLLRPRANNYGIRQTSIKAGKPNINPYAFYCLPHNLINSYLDDLCQYINIPLNKSAMHAHIDRALMIYKQFIFIHPFRDGNGRMARLLFLHLMQQAHHPIYACLYMLYLKNINQSRYHQAIHQYQQGNIEPLKKFYAHATKWTHQAMQQVCNLMQTYIQGIDDTSQDQAYSQIVYKQDEQNPDQPDSTLLKLFSCSDKEEIYLNNSLLSCLHQIDYYLRDQFRQHNQH
jgi:fido (protein-threonine AMPylation protein)